MVFHFSHHLCFCVWRTPEINPVINGLDPELGDPFSGYMLFFLAVQKTHMLLPVALPFFSSIAVLLPSEKQFSDWKISKISPEKTVTYLVLALMLIQTGINISQDVLLYCERIQWEETSPALRFYHSLQKEHLACLKDTDRKLTIFRDMKAYIPEGSQWAVETKWGLIDYKDTSEIEPDLIVLTQQTILDYTREDSIDNAADPNQMRETYRFLTDAEQGDLNSYRKLFENDFGITFAREDVYNLLVCKP